MHEGEADDRPMFRHILQLCNELMRHVEDTYTACSSSAPRGPAPEGPAPEGPAPEGPAPEGPALSPESC